MTRTLLPRRQTTQRGVVLLIALIMLVAMSLAGIAMMRQVSTGLLIAGNLSFKVAAVSASDRGIEDARAWLTGQTAATLTQAITAQGYYPGWCNTSISASNVPDANNDGISDNCATSPPPSTFDPVTYNWNNSRLVTSDDGAGNEVRYVVHRMCSTVGTVNATNQQCVTVASASSGASKGAGSYGVKPLENTVQPYYRITSRVLGPKNTVAYTQAIMY